MASNSDRVGYRHTGLPELVVLDEILVNTTETASDDDILALAQELGALWVGRVPDIRLCQFRFENESNDPALLDKMLAKFEQSPLIEIAYTNAVLSSMAGEPLFPDDGYSWDSQDDDCRCEQAWNQPDIRSQVWGQWAIDLPGAWAVTQGNERFSIGVVDGWFKPDHEDFSSRAALVAGEAANISHIFESQHAHGTHVGGILGATGDNGKGIAGVNWRAPLHFYAVNGFKGEVMLAVATALTAGEKLINLSYGRTWKWPAGANKGSLICMGENFGAPGAAKKWLKNERRSWQTTMKLLVRKNALIVASAGNNSDPIGQGCYVDAVWSGGPQASAQEYLENVIVVAAVGDPAGTGSYFNSWSDSWDQLWPHSNVGDSVSLAAPGAKILSLNSNVTFLDPDKVIYLSGTSMAAPFVTGVASLVWSLDPDLSPGQVKEKLLNGALCGGRTVPDFGFAILNAGATLKNLDRESTCVDIDGDGYFDPTRSACGCSPVDCDDSRAAVRPNRAEECNGRDDNCNGSTDEGLTQPCATVCGAGRRVCVNGQYGACDAPAVVPELCDGIDNDCNGAVDEVCDCTVGDTQPCYTGAELTRDTAGCHGGVQSCVAGFWADCQGEMLPQPEQCDGSDNDCSGAADDHGVCGAPVATAPLSGTVPGVFSYSGGSFDISVSPLDQQGNLITGGVVASDFSFSTVSVSDYYSGSVVTTASVVVDGIDIYQPGAQQSARVVIALDSSGSMSSSDPQRMRIDAARQFVDRLDPLDVAAVIDFGSGTVTAGYAGSRLLQDFTSEHALLNAAVARVVESGGTPLYDAIIDASSMLAQRFGSGGAVLVLTDGEDTASGSSVSTAISRSAQAGVEVFAVGLGTSTGVAILQSIAQGTGGAYCEAADAFSLAGLFDGIGASISQGRVVVHGTGIFASDINASGRYLISGSLFTALGGATAQTPFSFSVEVY